MLMVSPLPRSPLPGRVVPPPTWTVLSSRRHVTGVETDPLICMARRAATFVALGGETSR